VAGATEGRFIPLSINEYHASTVTGADGSYTLDFSATKCSGWYLVTPRSDPEAISCEFGVKGVVMNITIPAGR
jgi:hypothetical protein